MKKKKKQLEICKNCVILSQHSSFELFFQLSKGENYVQKRETNKEAANKRERENKKF